MVFIRLTRDFLFQCAPVPFEVEDDDVSDPECTQVAEDPLPGIATKVDAIASTHTIIDHQFKCGVNKRIRELQEKVESIENQLTSLDERLFEFRKKWGTNTKTGEPEDVFRRMNSMIDFLYSWVKGAEASGVFKLPPKGF